MAWSTPVSDAPEPDWNVDEVLDLLTTDGRLPTATAASQSDVKDSKLRKRERNREWMRRARLRKRSEQSDIQMSVDALQAKRDALMKERDLDEAAVRDLVLQQQPTIVKITQYRQLNHAYTEAEKAVGALREENYTLREELRRRGVSASIIHDLMQELSQCPNPQRYEHIDDQFQWFNDIDHLYEPLDPVSAADIVRVSHAEITDNVRAAEACLPGAYQVFGWNDRRYMDGSIANFMFDKTIIGRAPTDLQRMTWDMSTAAVRMKVLQPKTQRMKVLQVLDQDTLVIARQCYFPAEDEYHCNVYVLFRIPTPGGDGYMIGTRTIDSYNRTAMLKYIQCPRHLFTRLVYTFIFEAPSTPGGCVVKFGGRVDNVREQHARNCLMDVILAMLRWEAHCVAPILTLNG